MNYILIALSHYKNTAVNDITEMLNMAVGISEEELKALISYRKLFKHRTGLDILETHVAPKSLLLFDKMVLGYEFKFISKNNKKLDGVLIMNDSCFWIETYVDDVLDTIVVSETIDFRGIEALYEEYKS